MSETMIEITPEAQGLAVEAEKGIKVECRVINNFGTKSTAREITSNFRINRPKI